jgi:hypothetical protein
MNESNPETITAQPPPLPFKDRSTGLTVFGILTILLGCLAGLLVLLMLVGIAAAAKKTNVPPTPIASLLLAMAIYGGLAVALIWLGVGSIMARRWARALLLIFSWVWLGMGIIMVPMMGFIMPKTFANLPAKAVNGQPTMPPGAIAGIMVFMFLFLGVFFILLPAIWTFFYKSRHVKATCEARDPVTRWTDACPLPVLGLCLWLLLSVLMILAMPFMGHGVFPFFGMFLSGLPGSLAYVAIAALWAYCAYLLYKLEVRGWWLTLVAMVVYLVSSWVTFARHDMTEFYQRMGYPQAQIDQIQKMGLITGNHMEWMMLIFMVPFVGYLLFVKQYLRGKA